MTRKIHLYTLLALMLVVGCKTKVIPTNTTSIPKVDNQLHSQAILHQHQQSCPNFEALSAALQIEITNEKKKQALPFSLRMKKGEKIWLSAPLGLAKILLTPEKVQYYNKLDKTYYEGNYAVAKEMLGAELSFDLIENIILGQLPKEATPSLIVPQSDGYKGEFEVENHHIGFLLNGIFRLEQMNIQANEHQINAEYSYQTMQEQAFPAQIKLKSQHNKEENATEIKLHISNLILDAAITFPYATPDDYQPLNF